MVTAGWPACQVSHSIPGAEAQGRGLSTHVKVQKIEAPQLCDWCHESA